MTDNREKKKQNIFLILDNEHMEYLTVIKKAAEKQMENNIVQKELTDQDILKYCLKNVHQTVTE